MTDEARIGFAVALMQCGFHRPTDEEEAAMFEFRSIEPPEGFDEAMEIFGADERGELVSRAAAQTKGASSPIKLALLRRAARKGMAPLMFLSVKGRAQLSAVRSERKR